MEISSYLLQALSALGIALIIFRSTKTRVHRWYDAFDFYIRTGSRQESYIIVSSLVERCFHYESSQNLELKRLFADFYEDSEGKFITLDAYFRQTVKDVHEWGIPFSIRLDLANTTSFAIPKSANQSGADYKLCALDDLPNLRHPHIVNMVIDTPDVKWVLINQTRISNLILGKNFNGKLWLEDCWIKSIDVQTRHSSQIADITARNCHVGILRLHESSCENLTIDGGSIRDILCVDGHKAPPFTGAMKFINDPTLIGQSSVAFGKNVQNYRDVRLHLEKAGNDIAAKYIYGFEKRKEREDERGVIWLINFLYDATSFYGNRVGQPLSILALLTLFNCSLIYNLNGAEYPLVCFDDKAVGWFSALCGKDSAGQFWRSLVLGLQPIHNPLAIFSEKNLIVPAHIALSFWLFVQSVFSFTLIALVVIGIRTKFKYQ